MVMVAVMSFRCAVYRCVSAICDIRQAKTITFIDFPCGKSGYSQSVVVSFYCERFAVSSSRKKSHRRIAMKKTNCLALVQSCNIGDILHLLILERTTSLDSSSGTLIVRPGGWVAVQFTSDVIRTIVRRRHRLAL